MRSDPPLAGTGLAAGHDHVERNLTMRRAAARRIVLATLLCVGLATSCPACARRSDPPFMQVRSWTLADRDLASPQARPPAYDLRIEMAIISGSRWVPVVIFDAVRRTAAILAQCDIRISRVELHEYEAPRRYRYLSTPDSREFARLAGLKRPAVFLVDDTLERPAFDAEAVGRANAKTRPEMMDTVWITAGIHDLPVALAHELVHVLTDSGDHSDAADNLMRDETAPSSSRLEPQQCRTIAAKGQANGLLQRVPPADGRR